jgi:gliding motility-associated-like protein
MKLGNDLTASDIYSTQKAISPSLLVTDSIGCSNTYTPPANSLTPIVPVAKIISEAKVCLGTAALFSIDTQSGGIYKNNVDSFVWNFGDGTATVETKLDTISHKYKAEITDPRVTVTSYIKLSNSTEICTNSDSSKILDIKNAKASFDIIKDSNSCQAKFIILNPSLSNRFTTIRWEEKLNDSVTNKGDLGVVPFFTMQRPGLHTISYITTSDYRGCEADTAAKNYYINHSVAKFHVDKSEVCIKDTINFYLDKDTINIANNQHSWEFSNGVTDTTDLSVSYSYPEILKDSIIKITFYVITSKYCPPDGDSTFIVLHQVAAKFNRGKSDLDIRGCSPYTVLFFNTSINAKTSLWDFGDGTTSVEQSPTHTFTKPGITDNVKLSIIGSENGTACKDNTIKPVTIYQNPQITIKPDSIITCEGRTNHILLTPLTGTTIDSIKKDPTIVVSKDFSTATINPLTTTQYTFYQHYWNGVTGDSTCVKDTVYTAYVQNKPTYKGAPNNYLVYLPNDTLKTKPKDQLYAYVDYSLNNDSLPGVTYKWTPALGLSCSNCANPKINTDKDVSYTITLTDSNNCFKIVSQISFKTLLESDMGLPTAFTPNKDGSNDVTIPRGWGVKEFLELDVYNRWGQLVYKTNDATKGWDGTFKDRPQDPDTFAWTIKYKDAKDLTQEKKGYITLLR